MLLLWLVFVLDNTKFLLNLQVQEVGYFLQWSILQINFWTDAFGQLTPGEGRATDGNAAESWWMNAWVIFYQAWWVSWACFVGLFVARISRGRTIAEVIIYSLVAPILYWYVWSVMFAQPLMFRLAHTSPQHHVVLRLGRSWYAPGSSGRGIDQDR